MLDRTVCCDAVLSLGQFQGSGAEYDFLDRLRIGLLVTLQQGARVPPAPHVGDVFQAQVLALAGPGASERVHTPPFRGSSPDSRSATCSHMAATWRVTGWEGSSAAGS